MSRAPIPKLKPDWTQRFGKWTIPLLFGILLALIGVFLVGVLSILKSSEPYHLAVDFVRTSPQAHAALGQTIEPRFYLTGTVNVENSGGDARLSIPLRGTKASGTIDVVASRSSAQWHLDHLSLRIDGKQQRIELIPPPRRSKTPLSQP